MAQAPHFHPSGIPAQGLPSCMYLHNIHMYYITHTQTISDKRQHSLGSTQDSSSILRLLRIRDRGLHSASRGTHCSDPAPLQVHRRNETNSQQAQNYLESILDAAVNQFNVHNVQQRISREDLTPEGKAVPAISPGKSRDPSSTALGSLSDIFHGSQEAGVELHGRTGAPVYKALGSIPSIKQAAYHLALALPGHQQTRRSRILLQMWDTDLREDLVPTEWTHAVTLDVTASRTVSSCSVVLCYDLNRARQGGACL
jgi:hypothetical protein